MFCLGSGKQREPQKSKKVKGGTNSGEELRSPLTSRGAFQSQQQLGDRSLLELTCTPWFCDTTAGPFQSASLVISRLGTTAFLQPCTNLVSHSLNHNTGSDPRRVKQVELVLLVRNAPEFTKTSGQIQAPKRPLRCRALRPRAVRSSASAAQAPKPTEALTHAEYAAGAAIA